MIEFQEIEAAKHIVIQSSAENFPQASVLYSYLLMQHKKVSLFLEDKKYFYAFLPWYEKIRATQPKHTDILLCADIDIFELFDFFKKSKIKINAKMATAFYAGLMQQYDFCRSLECDGTLFAALSELIALGADHQLCMKEMVQKEPLSSFRLRAKVYEKLLLKENASLAYVALCDEDFEQSGAAWEDIYSIAKELFNLVHVKKVIIIKDDEKDKIIKISKEA